jgi:NADH dehydrogenase (ubiquinone) 1 alpha subcomplex subunit 9
VNVDGAERIAKVCAEEGVPRLIQVSHLNASTSSQSKFYQTKAEGEERVKAAFPSATIFRPASMYGYEDKLLNNIASKLSNHNSVAVTFIDPLMSPFSLAHLVEAQPG